MGFSYRKSFKAGPIRVTASKSGISYSAGVKGARVTKRADGKVQTTLSAPGTGLRYTSTTKAPRGKAPHDAPQQPLTSTPTPLTAKGYLASVTLGADGVHIRRTFMGKVNGNRSSFIPWSDIRDIRHQDPGMATNGYFWFRTDTDPDQVRMAASGQHAIAANRHLIMFTWRQRNTTFAQLRDALSHQ